MCVLLWVAWSQGCSLRLCGWCGWRLVRLERREGCCGSSFQGREPSVSLPRVARFSVAVFKLGPLLVIVSYRHKQIERAFWTA